MKKETGAVLYFVAATLFFAAAAFSIFGKSESNSRFIWTALGVCMFCLGAVQMKTKKEKKQEKENETDDQKKDG